MATNSEYSCNAQFYLLRRKSAISFSQDNSTALVNEKLFGSFTKATFSRLALECLLIAFVYIHLLVNCSSFSIDTRQVIQ
jgi:hypothetical protein